MTTVADLPRYRRHRQRKASGLAVLHVEVELHAHTELLLASGLLQQWDDHDRGAVEAATARLLAALARERASRDA